MIGVSRRKRKIIGDKKSRDGKVYEMGLIGIRNLEYGDVVEPEFVSIAGDKSGLEIAVEILKGNRKLQDWRVITDCGNEYAVSQIRRYGRAIKRN